MTRAIYREDLWRAKITTVFPGTMALDLIDTFF